MDIEACRRAGLLAAKVDASTEVVALVQQAIDGKFLIQNLTLRTMDGNGVIIDIPLGTLDVDATAAALGLAKTILVAKLSALNEQLVALV